MSNFVLYYLNAEQNGYHLGVKGQVELVALIVKIAKGKILGMLTVLDDERFER